MKGLIFRQLEKMVTTKLGLRAWDTLVERAPLTTRDGFIGSVTYPDADLFALVRAASELTGRPESELLRAFGRFVFPDLARVYAAFLAGTHTSKEFLISVGRVVHVEVAKLHTGAVLPEFDYEDPAPDRLVVLYRSRRRLCDFAAGLIDAVGDHFGEDIAQVHRLCTRQGAEHCRFELSFSARAD